MTESNTRRVVTREEWAEDRDALKAATLAHYDRLEACRTWDEFVDEGWSAKACPLCLAHRSPWGAVRCYYGCPVYLATRQEWCSGTPWMEMNTVIRCLGGAELDGPLPEVLAMRAYLDGLDWHRRPSHRDDLADVRLKGVLVTIKGG